MQAPAVTCPICQSELRPPVEERCPICLAVLPPEVQRAAQAAGMAQALVTPSLETGPIASAAPRTPSVSSPISGFAPRVEHAPWPGAGISRPPTTSVPLPSLRPAAARSGPRPAAVSSPMPAGPLTAAMLGPLQETYNGAYSGAAVGAALTGILSVGALFAVTANATDGAVCATAAFIICLSFIITAISHSGQRLYLHQGGIGLARGSAAELIRFDDVKNVWVKDTGAQPLPSKPFRIELTSGRRLSLKPGDYRDGARLAASLTTRLRATLAARALAEMRAGRPVTIGGVRLDSATISNGAQSLPWAAVDGARARDGAIQINQHGTWVRWSPVTAETPNTLALPGITSAIRGLPPPP